MLYKEISDKMDEGAENRTIGLTVMNVTSFLSYIIVTIDLIKYKIQEQQKVQNYKKLIQQVLVNDKNKQKLLEIN